MNFRNKWSLEAAQPQDAADIAQVMHNQAFAGGISVAYLRDPDPIASFSREGDELFLLVLRNLEEGGRLVGMGGCLLRQGYWQGRPATLGYLLGLKILPDYQKKFLGLAQAYDLLHQWTRDRADCWMTTILSDNQPVWRMLEKKHRNMPAYRYMGDYHTLFFKAGGRGARLPAGCTVQAIAPEAAAHFYRQLTARPDFALVDALQNDLQNAGFFGLYRQGALAAVAYCLDQTAYKQYKVERYGGLYRLAARLPVQLLGYPPFPRAGQVARLAAAGLWAVEDLDARLALAFWREVQRLAAGFDILLLGFHQDEPFYPAFARRPCIDYASRLYQVAWEDTPAGGSSLPPHLEVCFL